MEKHKASLYLTEDNYVRCLLCSQNCKIATQKRGRCGVRKNIDGVLYSLVYGELVAEHVDPIEKKPLFHIYPGSKSLSIATKGCNFFCKHCQNHTISQVSDKAEMELLGRKVNAQYIVDSAKTNDCKTISYTYVEPTVFFEFAYDCCILAKDENIGNVFVSNGYISSFATKQIAPYLTGINIDIKSFRDKFYKTICGARLQPVLDCVQLMKELGVWVEVTTLLIPGLNNSDEELRDIAEFLVSVDPNIPWHVSGFHPMYKLNAPPTTADDLKNARRIGLKAGLKFVYEGNMAGFGGENSYCPFCGSCIIERFGFRVKTNHLRDSCCPQCGGLVPGVW